MTLHKRQGTGRHKQRKKEGALLWIDQSSVIHSSITLCNSGPIDDGTSRVPARGYLSAPDSEPVIQIQDAIAAGDDDDADSSIGEEVEPSVVSISSSILAYRQENGRSYHALSSGKYVLPNDEVDLQHELYVRTLDGDLAVCPKAKGANSVLDMGTGTGSWAIDYADANPQAEVIGVDLSPIQPALVPPNVSFEIDDLEKEWTWTKKFDFIFARMMLGCFTDFPQIIKVAFDNLEPGGYLELQDMSLPARSDDGTLHPGSYLSKWCRSCFEAGQNLGRPVFPTTEYKNYLAAAGFVDIVEVQQKWPTNPWPRDKKFKELGAWACANIAGGTPGFMRIGLYRIGAMKQPLEFGYSIILLTLNVQGLTEAMKPRVAVAVAALFFASASAGPQAYAACQAGCSAIVMACYAVAGVIWGTSFSATAPPTIIACNTAFGTCSAKTSTLAPNNTEYQELRRTRAITEIFNMKPIYLLVTIASFSTTAAAGPIAYGVCQAGCASVAMACYAAGGATWGATAGATAPATIAACNSAFGVCSAACAQTALIAPTP
ncbi:methyltransferase [Fusarium napiforme]|uniref:Methyltransferase n=1 Tax=Fusarium napiforme TaxID=42672 RepID=A0A8H5J522_9HYPO|nr:methyltransferase [Fusarium napiforme]